MSDYHYYVEDGELYRFKIMDDDQPLNPRTDWDGNIGTLNLWWNRYALGDNEGKGDPDDMLSDIIRDNVPQEKWTDEKLDYDMSVGEKITLLQEYILLMPCYIYEHSGLAISCSNSGYPFNDRWDSGCAGFIYTTKDKCKEQWGKIDDDWKQQASEELKDEIHQYDMYLQNECYGYRQEKYNPKEDDWDEIEAVWGFLTDDYGHKLVEFFRTEITNEPLISETEADEFAREMYDEFMTMDQANNIVAI